MLYVINDALIVLFEVICCELLYGTFTINDERSITRSLSLSLIRETFDLMDITIIQTIGGIGVNMGIKQAIKHFEFKESDIASGKYSGWDLIQPLWYNVSIYDGIDVYNQDLRGFTEAQRRVLALYWYDSEVCNGGHDQFFSNSTGIVWKDALDGMKMIGDFEDAENLQNAVDLFGGEIPFDRDKRNELLDKLYENDDFDDFDEIDAYYYGGDRFEELISKYVRKHPSEFIINGDYLYSWYES